MQKESRQAHWEGVYTQKSESEVSWFQENPAPSIEMIEQVGATAASAIVDIGGGLLVWSTISLIGALRMSLFLTYPKRH